MIPMLGSGSSCLDHHMGKLRTIGKGALTLWELNIGLLDGKKYNEVHDTGDSVLVVLWAPMTVCAISFAIMLVAQLTCS